MTNDGDVSGNHGGMDAWVMRLDGAGNIMWQKCFGGSGYDFAYDIKETTDGGFVIAAATSSTDGDVTGNNGDTDIWIVNIDNTGSITWQKCFGGTNIDIPNSLQVTPGGGYIFTASTNSNDGDIGGGHADTCYWCARIDNTGNIEWSKCFNGAAFSLSAYNAVPYTSNAYPPVQYYRLNISRIENTPDGGYIISAQGDSTVPGNHGGVDYMVLKLGSAGQVEWQKIIGDSTDNIAVTVKPVYNGYIFTGNTTIAKNETAPYPGPRFAPELIKLDINGNELWRVTDTFNIPLTSNDKALSTLAQNTTAAANGDYLTTGYVPIAGFEHEFVTAWITRIDSTGNFIGITMPERANGLYDIQPAGDTGFITAGDAYLYQTSGQPESTYVAHVYAALYNANLLPVANVVFTAAKKDGSVLLQWQTSSEVNSNYFAVERSRDGTHFSTLAHVNAAGNSNRPRYYGYTDFISKTTTLAENVLFYRLREVDKDGRVTLSKTVKIGPETKSIQLVVIPNPVHNQLNLHVTNYTGKAAISIFDMAGRGLQQTVTYIDGAGNTMIDIPELANGSYIISALVNGKIITGKFVKL